MNPKTSLPLHSPLQLQALSSLTAKILERVSNCPYSHVLTIQFLLSPSQSNVMHWSTETIFITGNDDILGFFFFWLSGMQELRFLNRDKTHSPCSGSTESSPLDCQGSPSWPFLTLGWLEEVLAFFPVTLANASCFLLSPWVQNEPPPVSAIFYSHGQPQLDPLGAGDFDDILSFSFLTCTMGVMIMVPIWWELWEALIEMIRNKCLDKTTTELTLERGVEV